MRPLFCKENATSGRDSAMRLKVSSHQAIFGVFALQEFAPGRSVEIQLAHFDAGADGVRGGCGGALRAVCRFDLPRMCGIGVAAGECDLAYRGHAGQRLTAESHAGDALQIVERGDLAGGMAHQCQRQLLRRDAAAVVAHAQQFHTAAFQLHGDLCRTRIQAVFQQFLQGGSGPFDDLAGGDLVDEQVGE